MLTPLGSTLRSCGQNSLRAWAELALGGEHYEAWADLEHSVRHGEVAFEHRFGTNVWEYRRQNEPQGRLFDEAMAALANIFDPEIVESDAFARVRQLVDVGGGDGSLLLSLLRHHSSLLGVLFDLPHIIAGAESRVDASGMAPRCEVTGGDFFDSVPAGADGYLLSRVLHDWDDERARAILNNCRCAMTAGGKLVVIERLLPERFDVSMPAQTAALADLAMMVMTGGRERTLDEFRMLLERAGFRLTRHKRMHSGMGLIEATPA